jgi:hypothetical protein
MFMGKNLRDAPCRVSARPCQKKAGAIAAPALFMSGLDRAHDHDEYRYEKHRAHGHEGQEHAHTLFHNRSFAAWRA